MSTKTVKWQGKDVPATPIGFKIIEEAWSVYSLDDTTTMRVKHNLVHVYRVNGVHNPNGTPVYVTDEASVTVIEDVPEHLKKTTKEA